LFPLAEHFDFGESNQEVLKLAAVDIDALAI
jgi:hypothetical protein